MNIHDLIMACLLEGFIWISPNGEVRSSRWPKPLGCLSSRGYSVCALSYKGIKKQAKIHQIIWMDKNGAIPKGKVIDHINGIKTDNRISNLRLVTPLENSRNRRDYSGSKNPASKTCLDEAKEIRRLHGLGLSYSNLAESFSISKSLVASIIRGETWV